MVEEIWKAAVRAFGKDVYKAWPMICKKWEHALWHWNEQFGPLNPSQRDYFVRVIVAALDRAAKQEGAVRYASYQASVMVAMNHERVREGFTSRRTDPNLDDLYEGTLPSMQDVPA